MNQAEFNTLAAEFQNRINVRIRLAKGEIFHPKSSGATQELVKEFGTWAAQQYLEKIAYMNGEKVEKVIGFFEAVDQLLAYIARQEGLKYQQIEDNLTTFST